MMAPRACVAAGKPPEEREGAAGDMMEFLQHHGMNTGEVIWQIVEFFEAHPIVAHLFRDFVKKRIAEAPRVS